MARLKTKYRQKFRDGGRVDPSIEQPIEPQAIDAPADMPVAAEPAPPQPVAPPSDATNALRDQIESLKQSEALQRQQQSIQTAEALRTNWFRNSPLAQKFGNHLVTLHDETIKSGVADLSPEYWDRMDHSLLE